MTQVRIKRLACESELPVMGPDDTSKRNTIVRRVIVIVIHIWPINFLAYLALEMFSCLEQSGQSITVLPAKNAVFVFQQRPAGLQARHELAQLHAERRLEGPPPNSSLFRSAIAVLKKSAGRHQLLPL